MLVLSTFFGVLCATVVHGRENERAAEDKDNGLSIPDAYKSGMHVILLGVGARFHVQDEGGSSVLVVVDGEPFLFDVGPLAVQRMAEVGINPAQVHHLFVTHLHMDHISAFPEFMSLNHLFKGRIRVFGPRGVSDMVAAAKAFLKFDLGYLEPHLGPPAVHTSEIVEQRTVLDEAGVTVTATPTPHTDKEGESFAYRLESAHGSVVITGDTVPSLNVVALADGADILIHEVDLDPKAPIDEALIRDYSQEIKDRLRRGPVKLSDGVRGAPSGWNGHSTASEVGKVAEAAGVGTLVLYHRPVFAATPAHLRKATRVWRLPEDRVSYASKAELISSVATHFDGPVVFGEPLMVFELGAGKPHSQ